MMASPLAVEVYADMHARELRRRERQQTIFDCLGAILVALVLSSDWWLK